MEERGDKMHTMLLLKMHEVARVVGVKVKSARKSARRLSSLKR